MTTVMVFEGTPYVPLMHAEAFAQAWTQCIGTVTSIFLKTLLVSSYYAYLRTLKNH